MNNRVPITAKFILPGYPAYDGEYPREITLRAMTTVEEKMRLQSDTIDVIPRLINNCIVDENIDALNFKVPDIQRFMYALRSVTYGPEYNVSLKCPKCGNINDTSIDIDKLTINTLDEKFHEPFEIGPLPISGDVITCRLLSIREYIDLDQEAKSLARSRHLPIDDVKFNLEYQRRIVAINGQSFFPAQVDEYVNSLNMKDMRFFDCRYDEIQNSFGIDPTVECKCEVCKKAFEVVLPMTEEFFRPQL